MKRELKQIGSNLDVKAIIIHQVLKEAGIRNATPKIAEKLLHVGAKEKLFVGKLNNAYYKKSNPIYGIFADENIQFKNHLTEYLEKENFFDFSKKATDYYCSCIKDVIPATGGFLIFIHFENTETKQVYMLVLTINNKDGYVVNESDLTIQDIKNLDLSKVDVACMINITKWLSSKNEKDAEVNTYLSFVKGNKDISYYFLAYIDCDNKTTKTESTKRLLNALEAYATDKEFDRDKKITVKNAVYQYCESCITEQKEIQLSAISAIIDLANPNDFSEYAAGEEFGVSPIINGDKAQLRKIKYVIYKSKKYSVEFDANLLGTEVIYNKGRNELTLKNLPKDLIEQLPS